VKKGYTTVFLNLPQWGDAKIEVCVLQRDAPMLLRDVLESLGKHLSTSIQQVEEEETKDNFAENFSRAHMQ